MLITISLTDGLFDSNFAYQSYTGNLKQYCWRNAIIDELIWTTKLPLCPSLFVTKKLNIDSKN